VINCLGVAAIAFMAAVCH